MFRVTDTPPREGPQAGAAVSYGKYLVAHLTAEGPSVTIILTGE